MTMDSRLSRGMLILMGLALAVPLQGCPKKTEDSKKDDDEKSDKKKKGGDDDDDDDKSDKKKKKKKGDDDDDKDSKKKKTGGDDDDKSAKKKTGDDDKDKPAKKDPPKDGKKDNLNIVGSYGLKGAGPDGTNYTGSATITKIGGEMYQGVWKIGSSTYKGIAFRDGDVLSCGWSSKAEGAHALGVVAYLVGTDNSLDGVWFENGQTALGKEFLVGGSSNLTGAYTIKTGETADKKKYSGSVNIELKSGVYQLTWKLGSSTVKGLGLRNGDVLSAGFSDAGGSFGVLQYRITKGGDVLTGQWAQTGQKTPGAGTETMTRL